MLQIENEMLKAGIDPKGAELQSLVRKDHQIDYIWNGNPAFWAKHSPVLFPIVGTLKNNTYNYGGRSYTMGRHGFARDKEFEVESSDSSHAVFRLRDDISTWAQFPFAFELRLAYSVHQSKLNVEYEVRNPDEFPLYFSIGAHPAFSVPIVPGTRYDDYYLEFSEAETAGRWPIKEGLLEKDPEPFLKNETLIRLNEELFIKDAIVLQGLRSATVRLKSDKTGHGLEFGIKGWPHLGIWAAPRAPFVCIEPWQGHADYVSHNQDLVQKEGIVRLQQGEIWRRSWWLVPY